ncbi:phosphoribosylaminoimidazolesuccinocarboxamide synthase [Flavobacterium album]|uniref:Phosphoribosylaminoimidazolesuccinocarboxamide synthase n=1 Tax=Flavobacterium album TaxID=2175091 RepID=A0A2S1R0G9_9FLAO|nr:phosphoribosylaminoimidazolesuccinocarboxamide synthase [Flavobacterium album]AWH86115.1 phosphoribosylaminoimidazolesuccinocarboxamide synthase [Flavobacterium album]
MFLASEKTFRTKTGYCHILPDKIILTRDGTIGNIAKASVGNKIARILIIYGIIAAIFFYQAYNSYTDGEVVFCTLYCAAGLYLIYGITTSINNSAAPVIERSTIKSVTYKKAIPGLTRSRFEVLFEDNGKIKKRLILLPGSLSGGPAETENALEIMAEENLITSSE